MKIGFVNIIVNSEWTKMEERHQQVQNRFDRIVQEITCISADEERICQNFRSTGSVGSGLYFSLLDRQ